MRDENIWSNRRELENALQLYGELVDDAGGNDETQIDRVDGKVGWNEVVLRGGSVDGVLELEKVRKNDAFALGVFF